MTDVAAPAPADGVVIDTAAPFVPNPSNGTNIPQPDEVTTEGQPPNAEKRKSIDEIIAESHEKVTKKTEAKEKGEAEPPAKPKAEAKETDKATEKKPETKAERGADGKFQPREKVATDPQQTEKGRQQQGGHHEPPSRFSPDAKAEWSNAPDSVKAEVHRMQRELESGLHRYRETYNSIKDFDEYARSQGTDIRSVLTNYATLEHALVQGDPATKEAALAKVFQRAGINPSEWAAQQLGKTPDQREVESGRTITALQSEIAQLKSMVGSVASHVQQQKAATITDSVTNFAKSNPRFDELSAPGLEYSIQNILRTNMIPQNMPPQERLQKAYEMADRLNPATASHTAPLTQAQRPDAGRKSIAGPPSNGSDPSIPARKKGERISIDDAIKRAAARLSS